MKRDTVKENHHSKKEFQRTEDSIQARWRVLKEVADAAEVNVEHIPEGFTHHLNASRLRAWKDPEEGIQKIHFVTVKNHLDEWAQVVKQAERIKFAQKTAMAATQRKTKKNVGQSKPGLEAKNKELRYTVKRLTNELITTRAAYLHLIKACSESKQQSTAMQEAIRKHHQSHGLQSVVNSKEDGHGQSA